jgi:hypothetical protein
MVGTVRRRTARALRARAFRWAYAYRMWTPEDWVLQGDYCPTGQIRDQLARLRELSSSSILIHFALCNNVVLKSISFVSCDLSVPELEASLLMMFSKNTQKNKLSRNCWRLVRAFDTRDEEVRDQYQNRLLTQIAKFCDGLGGIVPVHYGLPEAPVRSLVLCDGKFENKKVASQFRSLAVMINATPSAQAARDVAAMNEAAKLPRRSPDADEVPRPSEEYSAFAEASLNLARNVTDAALAALYVRTATLPTILERKHYSGSTSSDTFPTRIDTTSIADAEIAQVLDHQRFIHRPYSSTFGRAEGEIGAELLCPLPWTSPVPDGPAAGLLVLRKPIASGSFSAYHRSLVRNVSLRLGMHRYATAAAAIGSAIAELRRRPIERFDAHLGLQGLASTPNDVRVAILRAQKILPALGDATDSHSVSLRLLLPSSEVEGAHGMALIQVAQYPQSEGPLVPRVQYEDDGANWTVVRSGRYIIHGDIAVAQNYTSHRAHTNSELSVPVRSEGRVVGTLNLESPYRDHYQALGPLVEAFGAAIGRVLADTSSMYAQATLSRSIQVDALSHDLRKRIDEAVDANERGETKLVLSNLRRSQGILDSIRTLSEPSPTEDQPINDIISQAIADSDMVLLWKSIEATYEQKMTTVAGHIAPILRPVLAQLFSNLKDHNVMTEDRSSLVPRILLDACIIDDRNFVTVAITNVSSDELDLAVVQDLYRIPVRGARKTGLRLGAYLAGVRTRSVGGTIHASILPSDKPRLRTVICVPANATQKDS